MHSFTQASDFHVESVHDSLHSKFPLEQRPSLRHWSSPPSPIRQHMESFAEAEHGRYPSGGVGSFLEVPFGLKQPALASEANKRAKTIDISIVMCAVGWWPSNGDGETMARRERGFQPGTGPFHQKTDG